MEKKLFTIDPTDQQSINQLLLDGKFEEAQNLLKKTMSSEKEEKAKDTAEVLGGPRSGEARKLAEQSNGKIVLRPDGKIDFPKLKIKGMGRLSVEGPTDLDNGLVQGGYQGGGIRGISYMTGKRAMKEVTKQGKKLLPGRAAEKIIALLDTLGCNGAEKSKALQALFGANFSGYWDPLTKKWRNVGSFSSLVLSEVDLRRGVATVEFGSSDAYRFACSEIFPQAYLACEDCVV